MVVQHPISADAPFLQDVLVALIRRSKALRHKGLALKIERIIETNDGRTTERLDLIFHLRKRQSISLTLWQDRAIWVHACEAISKGGWNFQFTNSGRLVGPLSGRDIVVAIEETALGMFGMTEDSVQLLGSIWHQLLARGPKAV